MDGCRYSNSLNTNRNSILALGNRISRLRIFIMIVLIISLNNLSASESGISHNASATGRWAGKDVILVPVSWCVVRGSPVIENPDIPNSNGGRDTTTDQVLLKRLER